MLNRKIAYNANWWRTICIALILGLILPLIIILLKPFDAEQYEASYKYLRIFGYAGVIAVCVLLLHIAENYWYRRNDSHWRLWQEIVFIGIATPVMTAICGVYNFYIVNQETGYEMAYLVDFLLYFGLPFVPFVIPVWVALRRHFGRMTLSTGSSSSETKAIMIQGDNQSDSLAFNWADFIYAQAQQNYVKFYFKEKEAVQTALIRSTLAKVSAQLPEALQVHRSYLVNANAVIKVAGNSRNRHLVLRGIEEAVPVSKKYYEAFKSRLANSSL